MGTKYSTESISGYNATPPADDGTVSEANKVKWSTIKTKLPDPLKTAIENIDSKLTTHFNVGPTALTSDTTLDSTHYNKIIQVSGSGVDLTLTDASTLGAGWFCDIVSTDSSNTVALVRATASNTIDATSADTTILPLESLKIFVNAAANGFITDRRNRSLVSTDTGATIGPTHTLYRDSASPAASDLIGGYNLDGEDSAGSRLTYAGIYGEIVDPGSTSADGRLHFRTVIAGTLSDRGYIGSGLVLGQATGGDQGLGTINLTAAPYVNGSTIPISHTVAPTTSATVHDWTSIPSWVKRITVMLSQVSTGSTSNLLIQLMVGGSPETSGYEGTAAFIVSDATAGSTGMTTGFMISGNTAGTHQFNGNVYLTLLDSSTNTWTMTSTIGLGNTNLLNFSAGSKSLAGVLDGVRLTTVSGDTFDLGKANIMYE